MTTTERFRAFLARYLIDDNPIQDDLSPLDQMDEVKS
jgi:hypothetical protein